MFALGALGLLVSLVSVHATERVISRSENVEIRLNTSCAATETEYPSCEAMGENCAFHVWDGIFDKEIPSQLRVCLIYVNNSPGLVPLPV